MNILALIEPIEKTITTASINPTFNSFNYIIGFLIITIIIISAKFIFSES